MSVEEFRDYWMDATGDDPAGALYDALTEKEADVSGVRAEVLAFVVPVASKGGWVPGFRPGVEDVAERLSTAEASLEEIGADIEEFMDLAGGPELKTLLEEAAAFRDRVNRAARSAEAARRKAEAKRHRASLAEIAEDDGVKEAEAALSKAKSEADTKTEPLRRRIDAARAIIAKYE